MTSAVVFRRLAGACNVHWRVEEKPETREARVRSDKGRNLRFYRSVDEEATMVARVPRTRSGSQESEAVRVSVPGAIVGTWGRMPLQLEVGFLGFGRDMPWSTYVLLVSSGEGLMCIYLKS